VLEPDEAEQEQELVGLVQQLALEQVVELHRLQVQQRVRQTWLVWAAKKRRHTPL
tara:strand:+ start:848 stop:1012 length:165 start_codon:yes stop_codon:yes gene_type:complete